MGKKILIVEDNEILNQAYNLLFNHYGFTVETAFNGQEALEKIESFNPHIILLDLLMPVMNGIEFLEKFSIKKKYKDIKILLLTNLGDDQEIKKAQNLGAHSYALKANMSPDELVAFVKPYTK